MISKLQKLPRNVLSANCRSIGNIHWVSKYLPRNCALFTYLIIPFYLSPFSVSFGFNLLYGLSFSTFFITFWYYYRNSINITCQNPNLIIWIDRPVGLIRFLWSLCMMLCLCLTLALAKTWPSPLSVKVSQTARPPAVNSKYRTPGPESVPLHNFWSTFIVEYVHMHIVCVNIVLWSIIIIIIQNWTEYILLPGFLSSVCWLSSTMLRDGTGIVHCPE